jgi:predicted nucleic acid-binding protein
MAQEVGKSTPIRDAVVDTCVVSFFFKRSPLRLPYEQHVADRRLIISFMTLAELDYWSMTRRWGTARIQRLEAHLRDKYVVYPFTRELCQAWAETRYIAGTHGFTVGSADAWVAATALVNNIPLITHNGNDFRGLPGLQVICETQQMPAT